MIISDLNYLEVVSTDAIEGSGNARLRADLDAYVRAQGGARQNTDQFAYVISDTERQRTYYSSYISLTGQN